MVKETEIYKENRRKNILNLVLKEKESIFNENHW